MLSGFLPATIRKCRDSSIHTTISTSTVPGGKLGQPVYRKQRIATLAFCDAKYSSLTVISHHLSVLKIGTSTARFDDSLDDMLCLIPIILVQSNKVDVVMLGNLGKRIETLSIKDK